MQNQKNESTQVTDQPLVNRVAQSGIITFVLEDLAPQKPISTFDIKDYLWKGLVLKEKDFRAELKEHDWSSYHGQVVTIECTADAIVPTWAYMLVAAYAAPHADEIVMGSKIDYLSRWYARKIDELDKSSFEDARVVVKGCSTTDVPESAYVDLVQKLQPIVRSLMFGEPCSTVPLYKRPKL